MDFSLLSSRNAVLWSLERLDLGNFADLRAPTIVALIVFRSFSGILQHAFSVAMMNSSTGNLSGVGEKCKPFARTSLWALLSLYLLRFYCSQLKSGSLPNSEEILRVFADFSCKRSNFRIWRHFDSTNVFSREFSICVAMRPWSSFYTHFRILSFWSALFCLRFLILLLITRILSLIRLRSF